ncbi:T-complex protein 1 subunit delta [Mycena kentingensis (nom. inval.)]|nr:T-complex protein 1 subunit delta [Mycena kentingensis (nom. inval.)]
MPKRNEPEGSSSNSRAPPQKKTRFVDPSEDPANFEEQVESALEQKSRKGRVRNEGYDSDSSDDGEGVVLSRRKDEEDEDEDMFAVGKEDADKHDASGGGKKKEEYLRLGDIEGQVFNDSDSNASSEEDEPEDEDDAERRKKAGMGFELSGFNMRDEMEEGKFTEDGSYVRTFDAHAVHDRWMEGVDERDMKLARRRKRRQEREQKDKMRAEEKEIQESGGVAALELQLLAMLNKGESVLEALQRLGVEAKRSGKKAGKAKATTDTSPIETMTHLASTIMSMGDSDIYSKTYEELVRAVRSSGLVDASWVPPSNDKTYEYKWRDASSGNPDETFGPFGKDDLQSWFRASYFGSTGEKVQVRETGGAWADWDDFFDL